MSSYDCPELPIETLSCLLPNCWDPFPPVTPIPPDALADNEADVEDPIMLNTNDRMLTVYQIYFQCDNEM